LHTFYQLIPPQFHHLSFSCLITENPALAADASADIITNREAFNKEIDNLIGYGYTTTPLNRPKKLLKEIEQKKQSREHTQNP